MLIGSKLDADIATKQCRLCFYGQVIKLMPPPSMAQERKAMLEGITIIKEKTKRGVIDKIIDNNTLHIRELFNKETAPDVFMNLKVTLMLTGQ